MPFPCPPSQHGGDRDAFSHSVMVKINDSLPGIPERRQANTQSACFSPSCQFSENGNGSCLQIDSSSFPAGRSGLCVLLSSAGVAPGYLRLRLVLTVHNQLSTLKLTLKTMQLSHRSRLGQRGGGRARVTSPGQGGLAHI